MLKIRLIPSKDISITLNSVILSSGNDIDFNFIVISDANTYKFNVSFVYIV